ncbi:MAG TPA: addiction module protein [Pirellulales bacterium]|nr:addiction module protein [Pirellulales bacterium]
MSTDSMALSSDAQHVFEAAMRLPDAERAKLADKLSATLDPMADPVWQAAWGPEIARRVAEVEEGTAKLHTWDELQKIMQEARHAPRKV